MNTDNMTISGETIDYGPCAFMETYDSKAVFSSIDRQGRYAYGNQPIAQWNLARLAEAVASPIDENNPDHGLDRAIDVIDTFPARYDTHWLTAARAKLGLTTSDPTDFALARDWMKLLERHAVDHTLAWRRLSEAAEGMEQALAALFPAPPELRVWLTRWRKRSRQEPGRVSTQAEAIEVAFDPDRLAFRDLLAVLFQIHDPTTENRQGNDRGISYRSGIYYTSEAQRSIAEETIADGTASGQWPGTIVTEVCPAGPFWVPEPEHQDYLERYPSGYTCRYARPHWKLLQRA